MCKYMSLWKSWGVAWCKRGSGGNFAILRVRIREMSILWKGFREVFDMVMKDLFFLVYASLVSYLAAAAEEHWESGNISDDND